MTISDYIQAIATEALPDYSYQYGRNTDINELGDDMVSPCVACIEPDQGSFNLSNITGNVFEANNVFIRFIQTIPDASVADNAQSRVSPISVQKLNAQRFIAQLSNDDKFIDVNSVIPWVSVIEAYDSKWYGVEINLRNLQFNIPTDVC